MRAFLLLTLALLAAPGPAAAVQPGQRAPAFDATLLRDEGTLHLSDFSGKVVYLDFWASWCGPCRQSLPYMEKLHAEFASRGLAVVAVNVDQEPADGRRFLRQHVIGYPVVSDAKGKVAALYDVEDMPSTYLIDRKGTVRIVHRGFSRDDEAALHEAVAGLVAEQP